MKNDEFKILLIENNISLMNIIKQWLTNHAEVISVMDQVQSTTMVQKHTWDLIIVDIELMGLTIFNFIKLVKSFNHWTAILIITSYKNIEGSAQALQGKEHADGIIFKPLVKDKFVDLVLKLAANTRDNRRKEQKVILAIGAHPDDVEIGCAGTLARCWAEGAAINILTLSSGESGGDRNARRNEAQQAAKVLHAQLFLEELVDTCISEGVETINLIETILQEVKPTHIYTHSRQDNHQDHRNVHLATMVAARLVDNIYCYQSPSCTIDFRPNLFSDISDYIQQKLLALACYKSQADYHPYLHEEVIRAMAIYWGRFAHNRLVEPMEIIRQTIVL